MDDESKKQPQRYWGSMPAAIPEELLQELVDFYCPEEALDEGLEFLAWPKRSQVHCFKRSHQPKPTPSPLIPYETRSFVLRSREAKRAIGRKEKP
jgi:hypothetical protein